MNKLIIILALILGGLLADDVITHMQLRQAEVQLTWLTNNQSQGEP